MTEKERETMEIDEILKLVPHSYPFVFVDRVQEFEPDQRIVCIKNVTINEPFFQGHFRDRPIMPGVLLVEAMAQAGGVLVLQSHQDEYSGRKFYFMGMDKVRFRKVVRPGDQVKVEARILRRRGHVWKFQGRCHVDGEVVAEAELMAMAE
jgi:beta-hydroxyacyl-ACP dehydratase FabZ